MKPGKFGASFAAIPTRIVVSQEPECGAAKANLRVLRLALNQAHL
jgi:hypothetical protein